MLSNELRKQLENAIKAARREAEKGARQALAALAVERGKPHASMTEAEGQLRTRLRAHGRQLGDVRDAATNAQGVERLVREVAYEHWHRMLFARFLAENQLLIEPESGVAISMAECEELAREQGEDPWVFAARAATRMLPRIFRPDDPALAVTLAPETRRELERLLAGLPAEVFTAADSLGWTYQFWQAERKKEVNDSGVKIGADELPAVTQLFTEHYMVQFLFHNTIGAWRAGTILTARPELARDAESEEELRRAVRLSALGGYEFSYLRFVREPGAESETGDALGNWRPAAGAFDGWPRRAAELRVLDPCCGSGHFLVEGLELLVRLRMDEEGLGVEQAIRAVLADNLFGLELDPRCTQIAAFNVALAAWKLAGKPIDLPPLQIACSGLAIAASKKEWLALAGSDTRLRAGMERLYDLFNKAPELGSLIDPATVEADLVRADFAELQPLLAAALARENNAEETERAVTAQGLASAGQILGNTYTLVVTNVPYLGRGDQGHLLKTFTERHYSAAKADLATVFVMRALRWLSTNATLAVETPQNWLFLTSYEALRRNLLSNRSWNFIARLGPGAFETISGERVDVALLVCSANKAPDNWRVAYIDASVDTIGGKTTAREKASLLRGQWPQGRSERFERSQLQVLVQSQQLENPEAVISEKVAAGTLLSSFAFAAQGLKTGDDEHYRRVVWEFPKLRERWQLFQGSVKTTSKYGGRTGLIDWSAEGSGIARLQGKQAWQRTGVAIRLFGRATRSTIYTGEIFDSNVSPIVPFKEDLLPALWCFVEGSDYSTAIRTANRKINLSEGSLTKVFFDLQHWKAIAADKYPNGLPEPESNDPTQWLFHGHPAKADTNAALQVAVARLLGYRWPAELDAEMRLSTEARTQVARCAELESFADRDGIVCLPAIRGEAGAADRLRRLLAAAFGGDWSAGKERELLAAAAQGGSPDASLEEWLRDSFFAEHCKLFHDRPFVWHVWDGRKDGFHALVNYHRLAGPGGEGRRTLEALTYSYLGDWIERQKAEQREGMEGADGRLAAALDLRAQLERILAGEPPFDIFVRWKPLHQQPIGWEPDIDDGVRLNIRPFLRVELRSGGRKGAGILRAKPNTIKWNKDRGNDPQSIRPKEDYPWFWTCRGDGTEAERTDFRGGEKFDGNRWNDLHYRNEVKRDARKRAQDGRARR